MAEPKEPPRPAAALVRASSLEPWVKEETGPLDADELLAKLQDAAGYQVVDEVQHVEAAAALEGGTEASHVESDDLRSSDDENSDEGDRSGGDTSDREGDGWARPELGDDEGGEDAAEVDLATRQAALEQELETCTLRVDELRKTLLHTRSFLKACPSPAGLVRDPGYPVRASRSPAPGAEPSHSHGGAAGEAEDNDDDDDDRFLEEYSDEEDDEEDEGGESEEDELHANSALIREATTGSGPGLHHLNIPPPLAPVTPKRPPVVLFAGRSPAAAQGGSVALELSDPPSPTGRLGDRVKVLRQRCVEGLGAAAFERAYRFLKALQDAEEAGVEVGGESEPTSTNARLVDLMGVNRVHYSSLIDQLIFMEDTLLD